MDQILQTDQTAELMHDLNEFIELQGDELDNCYPEAFDLLYSIIQNENSITWDEVLGKLSDFNFEFLEELEGCNDDGYLFFQKEIIQKYNIPLN